MRTRHQHGPTAASVLRGGLVGLAAGAAGTTALNTVTYLDMTFRARPSSSTPQDTADALAETMGVHIPGDDKTRANRLAGLGPLLGIAAGAGVGAVFGVARALGFRPPLLVGALLAGAGAMAATDLPMAALGVSDPRTWAAQDWLSDAVPHAVYGLVVCAVLEATDQS